MKVCNNLYRFASDYLIPSKKQVGGAIALVAGAYLLGPLVIGGALVGYLYLHTNRDPAGRPIVARPLAAPPAGPAATPIDLLAAQPPLRSGLPGIGPPSNEACYTIRANPRAGNPAVITISIADVSHLRLTERSLPEIFRLANRYTVNQPYPLGDDPLRYYGETVFRPNHNGTHSARQAAHLEALFDLIDKRGSRSARNVYTRLSKEEKLNLQLAAYFLRAGRVDESSHKNPPADDYYTRSALIYEEYAKQLNVTPRTIRWIKKLIENSCKPSGHRDADIDTNPKNRFGYEVLTMVHELDLIRCFGSKLTSQTVQAMKRRLNYFISDSRYGHKRDKYMDQLMEHAKKLCEVTGCKRRYDRHAGNLACFVKCSTEGGYCWRALKGVPIPLWV